MASNIASKRRDQRRFQQVAADAAIGLPDRRQRIGHAHRAAGNRRRHIQQFHSDGVAQARGASHLAMQGGDELRPRGMVFHLVGIGLGVGQHLAGGVDDGDPSACGRRQPAGVFVAAMPEERPRTREANIRVFCRNEVSISLRSIPTQAWRMSTAMVRVQATMTNSAATIQLQEDPALHDWLVTTWESRSGSPLRVPSSDSAARRDSLRFSRGCGAHTRPPSAG